MVDGLVGGNQLLEQHTCASIHALVHVRVADLGVVPVRDGDGVVNGLQKFHEVQRWWRGVWRCEYLDVCYLHDRND